MKGYLAPYKGERYHLPEFQRDSQPQNAQEYFNQAHSSLRSVIERCFGVWKARWHILGTMPSYPFEVQVALVPATMALHNFIIKARAEDFDYEAMLNDPNFAVHEDEDEDDSDDTEEDATNEDVTPSQISYSASTNDNNVMNVIRDNICAHMLQDWQ